MIRRRGKAPRRPFPALAPKVAIPAPHRVATADHIVLQSNLTCYCGEKACRWMRCRVRRCLVATCGGHRKTIVQERDEHEASHAG